MQDRYWNRIIYLSIVIFLGTGLVTGIFLVSPRNILSSINLIRREGLVLAILFVVYLLRPLIFGPMSMITIFVGFRFGLVLGLGIAVAGTVLTTLPPYLLSKRFGRDTGYLKYAERIGQQSIQVAGEFRGVVAARLSPSPADAVSYGAGLAGVSLSSYVSGTIVGELPWTITYLWIGASLHELTISEIPVDIRLIAVFTLIGALLVAPPVYRLFRSR